MEKKKKTEPDFELCGNCGAVLDKDSLFCKRCGVKLEPKKEEAAEEREQKLTCANCGAELDSDSRFCGNCGAEVVAKEQEEQQATEEQEEPTINACPKCGAALAEGDKFCQNCGAAVEGVIAAKPPQKRFCKCGTEIVDGIKFCHKCGAAVDSTASAASTVTASSGNGTDAATAKKRKIAAILTLIGSSLSVLFVFIFLCTPFISVSVKVMGVTSPESISQNGLGLIGVMFGGDSDLTSVDVSMPLLRFAGWLYAAMLLAIINHFVCVLINVFRYNKGKRPINILASNLAILIAALGALIVGIIARVQIGMSFNEYFGDSSLGSSAFLFELSCYLGFVGAFVFAAVGFACVAVGFGYSQKAFPPLEKGEKKKGGGLAILLTDLVCGVLIALAIIAPLLNLSNYNTDPEITVRAGDKGQAEITCDKEYDIYYVGTTVFELENISRYTDYTFTIKVDAGIAVDDTTLTLVYYRLVQDKDSDEIMDSLETAEVEWDYYVYSGNKSVTLSFESETYQYSSLAVVVNFVSMIEGDTFRYEYSFEEYDSML